MARGVLLLSSLLSFFMSFVGAVAAAFGSTNMYWVPIVVLSEDIIGTHCGTITRHNRYPL